MLNIFFKIPPLNCQFKYFVPRKLFCFNELIVKNVKLINSKFLQDPNLVWDPNYFGLIQAQPQLVLFVFGLTYLGKKILQGLGLVQEATTNTGS